MGFLGGLLTLPVLGAPRLVNWVAGTLAEEEENQLLDEGAVRGQLLELQDLYESGALTEDEYDRQEAMLVDRLKSIREAKEQRNRKI
jgi:hypothetical protein